MNNYKKSNDSLKIISSNSLNVVKKLRNYLETDEEKKKEWTLIGSKKDLAKIDDKAGIYFATYNKGGVSGKKPYIWLDIRYRGLDCSISTVWEGADANTNNIHHYFGQICFTKNNRHEPNKCPSPNTCDTTIKNIIERCKAFEKFLNEFEYKTVRQKNSFTELTTDNFLDDSEDKVNAKNVIMLFEEWAKQQIGKNT